MAVVWDLHQKPARGGGGGGGGGGGRRREEEEGKGGGGGGRRRRGVLPGAIARASRCMRHFLYAVSTVAPSNRQTLNGVSIY